MKQPLVTSALALSLLAAVLTQPAHGHHKHRFYQADPYVWGRVIDVQPIIETRYVTLRDRHCPRHHRYRAHSPTPVVVGAVLGAALGHRIGDGYGDPGVAAVAGGLLGASVGHDAARRHYREEPHCYVDTRMEARDDIVGYRVTYRYAGKLYRARMNRDPGDWVKLQVDVRPR